MSEHTPEQWAKMDRDTRKRHDRERKSLDVCRSKCTFPKQDELRPATHKDIVEGAVIYYSNLQTGPARWWTLVHEVYNAHDEFKAFCGDDGCRHGLQGAYVRIKP